MVSNVTACKPLFPVSFEIFRANVNHTNQEIICKIETSRKIILKTLQCQAEVVNWLFGKHTFF